MIIYKISCFNVKTSWWVCFKGVSSLSDSCLSGNVDDLLYDVTVLVGFCLVPEWNHSSDDVSNESSEDDEDKESDEIAINYCAIRTRSCSLIASNLCAPSNSYTIPMYMSNYEYQICRPFSVPNNIILRPSKLPTMTWRFPFCFAIVVAK